MTNWVECESCEGTGFDEETDQNCGYCQGRGGVEEVCEECDLPLDECCCNEDDLEDEE